MYIKVTTIGGSSRRQYVSEKNQNQCKQVVEHPTHPWYTPQILEHKCRLQQLQRRLTNTEIYYPAQNHIRLQETPISGCYSWQRGNPLMTSLNHSMVMQGQSLTL